MKDLDLTQPLAALETDEEWTELLEQIIAAMGCTTGTLHRYDPEPKLLRMLAQKGIPDELMSKVREIPIGKGIAGAAAQNRSAVQLCNLQTDTSGVARPDAKKTHVSGSLAVPILDGEELRGTLGVGMHDPHEFNEEETEKMWSIARWLAKAI
ncbi:MAG: GAF domain-containing protein [Verrucomicrobiales bacterium]